LIRYDEKWSERVKAFSLSAWEEINLHGDVIEESVYLVTNKNKVEGLCYLMETPTFRMLGHGCEQGHLNMNYVAGDGEDVLDVYDMLMERQIDSYRVVKDSHPEGRLLLRSFVDTTWHEYISYLTSFGFRAATFMFRMERDLTVIKRPAVRENFSFTISDNDKREIKVTAARNLSDIDGYFEANGQSFGVPDSKAELEYRILKHKGIQFVARDGEKIIAGVTVWENDADKASTENIFCAPDYRRKGIMTKFLDRVCSILAGKGYKKATLFVYGVNTYAIDLYSKLGYTIEGGMLQMLYEDDYVPEMV